MSYDVTLFAAVPGEDPMETVDELLESWDDAIPAGEVAAAAETVAALVAALAEAFPGAYTEIRRDGTQGFVGVDDGVFTLDVYRDHCQVCATYAVEQDVLGRIELAASATTAAAGFDRIYDPQSGEVIGAGETDEAMRGVFDRGRATVADIAAEYEEGANRGGFLGRLFRRR